MNKDHYEQNDNGKEQYNSKSMYTMNLPFMIFLGEFFSKCFHFCIKSWHCRCLESLEREEMEERGEILVNMAQLTN